MNIGLYQRSHKTVAQQNANDLLVTAKIDFG